MTIPSHSKPPFCHRTKKGSSLQSSSPTFHCLAFLLYGGICREDIVFWLFWVWLRIFGAQFIDNACCQFSWTSAAGVPFKAVDFTVAWNQNKEASIPLLFQRGAKPFLRLSRDAWWVSRPFPWDGRHHSSALSKLASLTSYFIGFSWYSTKVRWQCYLKVTISVATQLTPAPCFSGVWQ